ncbi:DUF309 domain-containing protein [Metabacillus herbersteinensis]|uniref:DUF309 domain-containing protein n=1 Tax=Metabacillus herbersteinensis TaxID=283816 RepID=A0ABV6GCY1_9BACI
MYDQAYIDYLVHFHGDRDYFECHEVLEEHWKEDPPKDRKLYWVGLIQIAVGLYHQRRGNFPGAKRMMANAIRILESEEVAIIKLGLHNEKLIGQLKQRFEEITLKKPYRSLNLPISDPELIKLCITSCNKLNLVWCQESNLADLYLVNRHSNRDRSDVIAERDRMLLEKRKGRNSL